MKLKEFVIRQPRPKLEYGFDGSIYKLSGTMVGIDIQDADDEMGGADFLDKLKSYIEPTDWKWAVLIKCPKEYPFITDLFNMGLLLKINGLKGYRYALCSDKNAQYALSYLGKADMDGIEYNADRFDPSIPLSKLGGLKGKEARDVAFKKIGEDRYEVYSDGDLIMVMNFKIFNRDNYYLPNYIDLKSISLKDSQRGNNLFLREIIPSLLEKTHILTFDASNRYGEKVYRYVKSGRMPNTEAIMATQSSVYLINTASPEYDTVMKLINDGRKRLR